MSDFANLLRFPGKVVPVAPAQAPEPYAAEIAAARIVADRILAEEREAAKGRPGRPPSGRVTMALIQKLNNAKRWEEADAISILMDIPEPKVAGAWELARSAAVGEANREMYHPGVLARYQAQRKEEKAEEARTAAAEARRVKAERARWPKKAAAEAVGKGRGAILRFSLQRARAEAFDELAAAVGVTPSDLGRLVLANFAALDPAAAFEELAKWQGRAK